MNVLPGPMMLEFPPELTGLVLLRQATKNTPAVKTASVALAIEIFLNMSVPSRVPQGLRLKLPKLRFRRRRWGNVNGRLISRKTGSVNAGSGEQSQQI